MDAILSKEKLSLIVSNYDLGSLKSSRKFTNGSVQTNILLETDKGKYVLRYYKHGRSLKSVTFEVNLINYLKRKAYPCPGLYKNNQGNFISLNNEKPYVIFEFIEGNHIENPNEEQLQSLIKRVAELQNITKNYSPVYNKYRLNYNLESCKTLAKTKAKGIATANSSAKLNWYENELSKLVLPKSLPKGICHCDFHFSNALFKNNKFNALIDFDDANYTYLMFDLVWLANPFKKEFEWNTWNNFNSNDNILNLSEVRDIVAEYNKYRQLNNNEKCHFYDLHKLSILIDCIWYFERGSVEDFFEKRKIDSLNKLGRKDFYSKIFL
jgi:homoserine kinase type II